MNGCQEYNNVFTQLGLLDFLLIKLNSRNDDQYLLQNTILMIMGNSAIDKKHLKLGLPYVCKLIEGEDPWFVLGILRRILNNYEEEYVSILNNAQIMPNLIKLLQFIFI